MTAQQPQPFLAIALKLGSVLLFVFMSSLIKAASTDVPPGQAVFFRSFFAIPIILGFLAMRGELRNGWKTSRPLGHLWRGLIGTSAMALSFAGLAILPLSEVQAIQYATPILVVLFAGGPERAQRYFHLQCPVRGLHLRGQALVAVPLRGG